MSLEKPGKKICQSKYADGPIPASEVNRLKNEVGLSNAQGDKALAIFRSWKGRKTFESNLKGKLQADDRILKEYFGSKEMLLDSECKVIAYCTDVKKLIADLLDRREVSNQHIVKIGIDGGGGFLKVCLSILEANQNQTSQNEKKFSYADGLSKENYKDGGVQKLIILAIVEDVKESHENIKMMIDLLEINSYTYFCAFDMKLANLYFGIEGAMSTHPCPWCTSDKKMLQDPNLQHLLRNVNLNNAIHIHICMHACMG